MDRITLILTTLTVIAKDTASATIKDSYDELKALIQRKPAAEMALTGHEMKPNVWKALFEEELKEKGTSGPRSHSGSTKVNDISSTITGSDGQYSVQITGKIHGYA